METQGRSTRDDLEGEVRVGWRMGGLGMEVSAQVFAGAVLGWLFDRWRGTGPTGLVVGSLAGIVIGLWSLIRGALKLNRELERKHPTRPMLPGLVQSRADCIVIERREYEYSDPVRTVPCTLHRYSLLGNYRTE